MGEDASLALRGITSMPPRDCDMPNTPPVLLTPVGGTEGVRRITWNGVLDNDLEGGERQVAVLSSFTVTGISSVPNWQASVGAKEEVGPPLERKAENPTPDMAMGVPPTACPARGLTRETVAVGT